MTSQYLHKNFLFKFSIISFMNRIFRVKSSQGLGTIVDMEFSRCRFSQFKFFNLIIYKEYTLQHHQKYFKKCQSETFFKSDV